MNIIDLLTLAKKIAASIYGERDQDKDVVNWLDQSEHNKQLYNKLGDTHERAQYIQQYQRFNKQQGWKQLQQKQQRLTWQRHIINGSKYAAFVALLIACFVIIRHKVHTNSKTIETEQLLSHDFQPSLHLENGEIIDLARQQGSIPSAHDAISINNMNTCLTYQDTIPQGKNQKTIFHELTIPPTGEFKLKLSDGTLVYLNSATKLKYPVRFDDVREVYLEGEAYFDVAPDKAKPFIVKTSHYNVEVTGTQFNISSYPDDEYSHTTLVSGKVNIHTSDEKLLALTPNKQFRINYYSQETTVRHVDVRDHIGWKEGQFRFKDLPLHQIMKILERWYGVTVFYEKETIKDLRFGFNVERHATIDPLLKLFEINGKIKIIRNGNVLRVRQGRL